MKDEVTHCLYSRSWSRPQWTTTSDINIQQEFHVQDHIFKDDLSRKISVISGEVFKALKIISCLVTAHTRW